MTHGFLRMISNAINEGQRAARKFPQPNYVALKVAEEAGEVVKAAVHCAEGRESMDNARAEVTQLVAMLWRLWEEGDAVIGLAPLKGGTDDQPLS